MSFDVTSSTRLSEVNGRGLADSFTSSRVDYREVQSEVDKR